MKAVYPLRPLPLLAVGSIATTLALAFQSKLLGTLGLLALIFSVSSCHVSRVRERRLQEIRARRRA